MMDVYIQIDTIVIELHIVYFKNSHVNVLNYDILLSLKVVYCCFNIS